MDKPHVYFGLFLTALRREGLTLFIDDGSDASVADYFAAVFDGHRPGSEEDKHDADLLHAVFLGLVDAIMEDSELIAESFVDPDMVNAITTGAHNGDVLPEQPAVAPGFVEVDLSPEQQEVFEAAQAMRRV